MDKSDWEQEINEEIAFWANWLETKGSKWPEDYRRRLDPEQRLPPLIEKSLLGKGIAKGTAVKVLDLGAGPLTLVGKSSEYFQVDVLPVDPLAEEYNQLLDEYHVDVPVRTVKGAAETLDCVVGEEKFNVIWICNSLDHSYDPVLGLFQAYKALAPEGSVLLIFHPNEADVAGYHGLHNWNFDVRDGNFLIESRGRMVNVSEMFSRFGNLRVLPPKSTATATSKTKLVVELVKTQEISLFDLLAP